MDWTIIVTISAVVGAAVAIWTYFAKVVRFIDRQTAQDKEIRSIKEEQQILVYGVLACLKGLQEQGCDGSVTKAIDTIEKHLNKEAHR